MPAAARGESLNSPRWEVDDQRRQHTRGVKLCIQFDSVMSLEMVQHIMETTGIGLDYSMIFFFYKSYKSLLLYNIRELFALNSKKECTKLFGGICALQQTPATTI